jgi:tetratricopeptide (TPR) repeat protein
MKGNHRWILGLLVLGLVVGAWQLPSLLKAIPSRYVAAYLPESVQRLSERDQADVLPTAALQSNARWLLPDPTGPTAPEDAGSVPTSTASPEQPRDIELSPVPTSTPSPTAAPTITPIPIPVAHRLEGFRHHFQTWNNCGPATLAMGLSYFGLAVTQEQTAADLKPDPEDRNVSPYEMASYVNRMTDLRAMDRANGSIDTLKRLLAANTPVIVELGLDPPGEYRWMGWYGHYLLVVAYDDRRSRVWVYDSWFGTSEVPGENANPEGRQIAYDDLDRYWRQFNRNYIVIYGPDKQQSVEAIVAADMDDENMWQRALEAVQHELSQEQDNPFLWFNLGTIYTAQGNYERAAEAFDQARAIGLPWRMLWYQFGPYEAYYQVGRYDDVLLLAEVTLKDRPYFEESYYYRGLALQAQGRTEEALNALRRAARFNPNYEPAANALAQLGG